MTNVLKTSAEALADSELDVVTGGAAPGPITSEWVVGPEFHSVFSRYVLGRYTKQPE